MSNCGELAITFTKTRFIDQNLECGGQVQISDQRTAIMQLDVNEIHQLIDKLQMLK